MPSLNMENTTVNLNGHEVTGWSDDADCLSMPDIDITNIKRGADGQMVSFSTGEKGGPVIIKLLPTSSSNAFFKNALTTILNGGSIEWNGTVRYHDIGVTVALARGVLMHGNLGQSLGKGDGASQEFTFEFERVIPDYSAFSA